MIRFQTLGIVLLSAFAIDGSAPDTHAAPALENELVRAEFGDAGLVAIHNIAASKSVALVQDHTAIFLDDESLDTEFLQPTVEITSATSRVYRLQAGRWTARIIYELQAALAFRHQACGNNGRRRPGLPGATPGNAARAVGSRAR